MNRRGYFSIGVINPKHEENIGTLWRSAHILGARYIFTINRRYRKQVTDTSTAWDHVPLFHYETFDQFYDNLPRSCVLVGVETNEGHSISYSHLTRACYLLGSEDGGIPNYALDKCHHKVFLPGEFSMNVAVAGSILMYDRIHKIQGNEFSQPRVACVV